MDITTQGQGYETHHLRGERSQEEAADCRPIDVVAEGLLISFAAFLSLYATCVWPIMT